jgi:hypothetical protein
MAVEEKNSPKAKKPGTKCLSQVLGERVKGKISVRLFLVKRIRIVNPKRSSLSLKDSQRKWNEVKKKHHDMQKQTHGIHPPQVTKC